MCHGRDGITGIERRSDQVFARGCDGAASGDVRSSELSPAHSARCQKNDTRESQNAEERACDVHRATLHITDSGRIKKVWQEQRKFRWTGKSQISVGR